MFLKINKAFYQRLSKFNKTTKCSATFTCYNIFSYSLLKAQPFFYSYQTHASCCVSNQGWNRSVGQTCINFNVSKTQSQCLYLLCDFRCKVYAIPYSVLFQSAEKNWFWKDPRRERTCIFSPLQLSKFLRSGRPEQEN